LDFLRRVSAGDPVAAVARWAQGQEEAVRQFRAMVTRAQAAVPVTPAMLAQIAGQARNLLAR
jgi:glutamate dehydrogenase